MANQISFSNIVSQMEGVWPLISKERLPYDLQRSLEYPSIIKKQPLPGADVVAELIQRNPQTYMRSVQSLWQNGSVCYRSRCIKAPAWAMKTEPPTDVHTDVWIILISLNGKVIIETSPFWQQWLRQYWYKAYLSLLLSDLRFERK